MSSGRSEDQPHPQTFLLHPIPAVMNKHGTTPLAESASSSTLGQFFKAADVAKILGGINRQTLYRILDDGEIEVVWIGKQRFIHEDELRRYIAANTRRGRDKLLATTS